MNHGQANCHGTECKCEPGYCSEDGHFCRESEESQFSTTAGTGYPQVNCTDGTNGTNGSDCVTIPAPPVENTTFTTTMWTDIDYCGIRKLTKQKDFHKHVGTCIIQECSAYIFE